MKALGMYIFCGSQTIGHLLEGWSIDTILEMTDDMKNQNAYHFIKNYPNIEVKLPSEYENNEEYLAKLKDENYDLLYSNPPCSGLSQINKNACADNEVNKYIYKVANMVKTIKPKTFLIENAPTLTSTGLPILKDIVKMLNDYRFIIINDVAGNHNVAMSRRRTFVIGFNKKYFTKLPKIHSNAQPEFTVKDLLKDIDYTYNKEFVSDSNENLFKYYNLIKPKQSFLMAMTNNNNIKDLPEDVLRDVDKIKHKLNNNQNIWDKSPWRPSLDGKLPSLASVVRVIHPIENRDFYVREYAAMMGYPNNFVFYPNECKTPIIQCIAQGVPVNFIRYISSEIRDSFKTNEFIDGEIVYINQTNPNNIKETVYKSLDEFYNTNSIMSIRQTKLINRNKLF